MVIIRNVKDEQDFYKSSITANELNEIRELDKIEWQEDIIEKVQQEVQEKSQEQLQEQKINFARSLLDVLDDETIAEKTGLDIDLIKALRI